MFSFIFIEKKRAKIKTNMNGHTYFEVTLGYDDIFIGFNCINFCEWKWLNAWINVLI